MSMVRINLTHRKGPPKRTIISVNGHELMEVNTFSSNLTFLQNKINQSGGKSEPGEYWFEVED